MKTNKRGQVADMSRAFLALVVAGIVMSIGAYVISEISGNLSGTAKTVAENGTLALADGGTWLPIIAVVIAASIVLGLISFFRGR